MLNALRWPVRLSTALLIVAIAGWTSIATAQQRTYTLDADFDEGTLVNVNHDTADQLQLDETGGAFDFIWVAASGRGTIIKIDTKTGDILGEYWSAPNGRGRNPSRTTVDANGNVWAGNRAEVSPLGSIVHVGLEENGQCIDKDGSGTIETSTGLGDIMDWTNLGGADSNGGVSTAEDECIIHYTRTAGTAVRTVAVDASNDVWVGGYNNKLHEKIDGTTGLPVPGTAFNLGCGGYGGLIDGNGILWSANLATSPGLLRYDPNTSTGTCINIGRYTYGLGLDAIGNIWNSNWTFNTVTKISPTGGVLGTFSTHDGSGDRGVTVTPDGDVWIANSSGTQVTRLSNTGIFKALINVGSTPTGLSVDSDGKVWVTNYSSHNVMRINPATNLVDLTVSLGSGANPYNYSDMTGSLLTAPPSAGTWTVEYDAGTDRTWSMVSWNADVTGDGDISVTAASKPEGGIYGATQTVTDGAQLVINDGRYLKVSVSFTRATTEGTPSPILYDLTITANRPPIADANGPYLVGVGGTIPLDGTGSSDPDGDPLTYEWDLDLDGIFGETGTDNGDETGDMPDFTEFDEGAGIITVPLKVTDPYGAFDIDEAMIVIYDPNAGFVTGGGWFYSEPGFCVWNEACELAEGKATFGFVSKYKKGRSVPEGNTEFQFHAGDLNFHSSAYEWLIIAKHKAMYKGVGTINGLGNYGFILTAIDAALTPSTDVDLFRINIWDMDNFDETVYDNQVAASDEFEEPTMAIDAGNIVIHSGGKARKADEADLADAFSDIQDAVPAEYELGANYPNPFNPQTTITFDLPETGHVTLSVFDVLGRRVSLLIDNVVDAGQHTAVFDAHRLPSGTYIYRLETLGGTFTRTMLLVK